MYDGVEWQLITVRNKSEVHALAEDDEGNLFIGAQGDFGYLEKSVNNEFQYHSLLHLLDSTHQNFNDVWSIHITKDRVIFRSTKGLYLYDKQTKNIVVIPFQTTRHRSFFIRDEVWVRLEGEGLLRLEKDALTLVPGGESLKHESLNAVFPYADNQTLVISEKRGLLLYDGKSFTQLENPVNPLLLNQNSFGKILHNGHYAIGTRTNGLIILDSTGKLLHRISKKEGLIDESIWFMEEDRFTHNLWVACNNGISLVELGSPFTSFQDRSGSNGQFYFIAKQRNYLYATSSLGLFRKKEAPDQPSQEPAIFQVVGKPGLQTWHLYCDSSLTVVTSNEGIFTVEEDKLRNIGFTNRAWSIVPLKQFPGYLLVNTVEGLVLLHRSGNSVQVHRKLGNSPESLYYFAEDSKGSLWANSPTRGIYRLRFVAGMDKDPEITLFTERDGFPSTYRIRPFELIQEVLFGTEKGLYRFNEELQRVELHPSLNEQLFGSYLTKVELLKEDRNGNLWGTYIEERNGQSYPVSFSASPTSTGYEVNQDIFRRIKNLRVNDIQILNQNDLYLSTSDGIVHYNPSYRKTIKVPVLLRSIEASNQDSTYTVAELTKIPFHFNDLHFRFAGMGFTEPGDMEYSYLLEGFDQQWSAFKALSQKEYTNLPAGNYTFKVKARSLQNVISEEASISFTILTPWYQNPLAILFYVLATTLAIVGVVRWRSSSLRLANQQLEKNIEERTVEIKKQNLDILDKNQLLEAQKEEIEASREEIENANRVIAEQNENLKYINSNLEKIVEARTGELQTAYTNLLAVKQELDTFIYRSSHDIKGPLTRLLGLCHVAKLDVHDKSGLQYINLLETEINYTNRILQKLIIYQNIKTWELKYEPIYVSEVLEKALSQVENFPHFEATAVEKPHEKGCYLLTDGYLVEVAILNVIENAILFNNNSHPKIRITCEEENTYLLVTISDNGLGINNAITDHIFTMFYRGSEKSKGAGLGLFIAKQALDKLGGHIQLKTLGGWSTTFEISLPLQQKS